MLLRSNQCIKQRQREGRRALWPSSQPFEAGETRVGCVPFLYMPDSALMDYRGNEHPERNKRDANDSAQYNIGHTRRQVLTPKEHDAFKTV